MGPFGGPGANLNVDPSPVSVRCFFLAVNLQNWQAFVCTCLCQLLIVAFVAFFFSLRLEEILEKQSL